MAGQIDKQALPVSLLMLSTYNCNLACDYCYVQHSLRENKRQFVFQDKEAILQLIKTKNIPNIKFYGGEPLIEKEFYFSLIEEMRESGIKSSIFIGTNGLLLTAEDTKFLLDNEVNIVLSMDGFSEQHNLQRKYRNNLSAGKQVLEKFQMIKELCGQENKLWLFAISLVVLPDNKLREIFHWLYQNQIRSVGVNILYKDNLSAQESQKILNNISVIMENIENEGAGFKKMIIDNLLYGAIKCYRDRGKNVSGCQAEQAVLASDGDIFFCGLVEFNPEYKIGSLRNGIDENKRSAILKKYIESVKKFCYNCEIERLCKGGCPEKLRFYSKDYALKDNFYCRLMRLEFNLLLKLIEKGVIEDERG